MSATLDTPTASQQVRLDRLFVPDNVRALDPDLVDRLVLSIKARGQIVVPVCVIDADPGVHGDSADYVLVAGFHRVAAAKRLGLDTVPAVHGDPGQEHGDRALENITRGQLNAYDEARAVKAMLDAGYTPDGAAALLGWDKRRVSARLTLLSLPERAQRMVGDGALTLSCVTSMRQLADADPKLLEIVLDHVEQHGDQFEADQLAHRPLWVLERAMFESEDEDVPFVAQLRQVPYQNLSAEQLGSESVALIEQATELSKKVNRYSYGPPTIRFTDTEIDRARAAGVLLEQDGEYPLCVDQELYLDLCRAAITAGVATLQAQLSEHAQAKTAKAADADRPADPLDDLRRDHSRQLRQLAATAHSANLDLGDSLRKGLSVVDPADMNVAKFFCYAALGSDPAGLYSGIDSRVAAIALRGIRLVIDQFREDATKTKKDGSKGALRIVYGDGLNHDNHTHWLWDYLQGARDAGSLYGRTLVVICAERYASRLVLPSSQQRPPLPWASHQGLAVEALQALAGPHIAPTLTALAKAVEQAEREHREAQQAHWSSQRQALRTSTASSEDDRDEVEDDTELDEDPGDDSDLDEGLDGEHLDGDIEPAGDRGGDVELGKAPHPASVDDNAAALSPIEAALTVTDDADKLAAAASSAEEDVVDAGAEIDF